MRPVFIASSPNTTAKDNLLALQLFLQPWKWNNQKYVHELALALADYQHTAANYLLTDSARSALYLYLSYLRDLNPQIEFPEIIVPAFTCLVVINAIKWAGFTPIYIDIDPATYNLDISKLAAKITPNTLAIFLQHTFGMPVDIQAVKKSIKHPQIKLIEDCAHAIGGEYQDSKLGTLGDASIFTFGIEKVISGVRGGALYIKDNNDYDEVLAASSELPKFPAKLTLLNLLNPLFWAITLPLYNLGIGKLTWGRVMTLLAHKLGLLGNMITAAEKVGKQPNWLPSRISPPLARLASTQLKKLDLMNVHRRKIAQVYAANLEVRPLSKGHIYLRYPLVLSDQSAAVKVWKAAKQLGITLGDWYATPLALITSSGFSTAYDKELVESEFAKFDYYLGECPVTEDICKRIVNLPTGPNITVERATELAKRLKIIIGN